MSAPPRKLKTKDGEVYYECTACDSEVQEDGQCFEGSEPCYYCPPDETCKSCGRGFCDQSC